MPTDFENLVYAICARIPKGKVATYGSIARAIGRPKSARAVGNALHKNPFTPQVPCHRVICRDKRVGGFATGSANKILLLRREGVIIEKNHVSTSCVLSESSR